MSEGENDWVSWYDRGIALFAVMVMLGGFFEDVRAVGCFAGVGLILLEMASQRKLASLTAEVSALRARLVAAPLPVRTDVPAERG